MKIERSEWYYFAVKGSQILEIVDVVKFFTREALVLEKQKYRKL